MHFDGNEKRVNNMTTLTLSIYHPLIRKQIILATLNCEGENKENAELFWRCWEEALGGKNGSTCFNPTGIILDEKGSNWKAVENVYGKELLHRCYSCEFHFKQSVNRRLKDPTFNNGLRAKFQSLCKQMLESSNKANFKRSVQKLEDFLDEEPGHAKLKDWLNWWVLRKEHIFRAFKDTLSPHSNLAEVIHSSWVSTKRTHLSIYECTLDDVAEFVTIKQMLKGYEEGNFGGGTGPSYMQINSRKDARNNKASFTVIEEDSSPIHYNDENDGFSPPTKRRSQSKSKTKKITKNVSSSKCDDSPNEASFDDLSQEESSENVTSDEEKRLGNERSKRSSAFMIAWKNMKDFAQKT